MKPYLLPIFLALLAGILFVAALLGPSGWQDLERIRSSRRELVEKRLALEEENARLRKEIEALTHSQPYLERMIRTRLGWLKEGERLMLVPNPQQASPP